MRVLYQVQKKDFPRAAAVLADAFRHDPLWNRVFEGESNLERKYRACFETPIRFCHRFGDVCATSGSLEGVIAWLPGEYSNMTVGRVFRSGAVLSGMRMGAKVGRRMPAIFSPLQTDREQHMSGKRFLYLMVIGVAPAHQRKGHGGSLVQSMVDKGDEAKTHLYLETEIEGNVAFYERFGFRVVKEVILPVIHCPMWEMVREPGGS